MGGPMAPPPGAGAMPPPGLPVRAKGGKVHDDAAEDKALIMKTLKSEGLTRSSKPEKMGLRERADGGRLVAPKRLPSQKHHMESGSVTGNGRLEKIGETSKIKNAGKPQAV